MSRHRSILLIAFAAALYAGATLASAQQSFTERFAAHNKSMGALQPAWITPLVAPDPRLVQYAKLSFANQYTSTGTQTVSYGNNRGVGVIGGNRYEFDFIPPSYVQHNSKASDGFGDTSMLVKYRIVSGNAEHGNFIVTALLSHCFATGSHANGAKTDSYGPAVVGGIGFGRHFQVESSAGGTLPTGKIAAQGRTITWNLLAQSHATQHIWFELENNATFYHGGAHDGKVQNFITPAAFYVVRSREWKPTHPFLIFDCGMQIATSGYHSYNHNLISEMRILF
jgi:hypothetical protein